MKSFKKIFYNITFCSVFALTTNSVFAVAITDVPKNYWAADEIVYSINNNIIEAKEDKFLPAEAITRSEFANAVYRTIERNVYVDEKNFKDISNKTRYSDSILSLNQLRVIFGYPDGNFKPEQKLKRSEASSVVANVVRSDLWNINALDKFKDKNDVPKWAADSYISNILNDIYVNYPVEDKLLPSEYLTRAEAAVLMVKLKNAIENYKLSYMPAKENTDKSLEGGGEAEEEKVMPVFVGTNTLAEFQPAMKNQVDLYDSKKIILAGNIVPVKSLQKINSKKVNIDDVVEYTSPKDIYSAEGTLLYSAGTKFTGYVDRIENSFWFKRKNKAYIVFNKAVLTNGTEFPIAGVLYSTYGGDIVLEKSKNSIKVQRDAKRKFKKRNAAIRLTDKLVPVIKYKENGKNSLFMLLTADMIIPDSSAL